MSVLLAYEKTRAFNYSNTFNFRKWLLKIKIDARTSILWKSEVNLFYKDGLVQGQQIGMLEKWQIFAIDFIF